MTLGKFYLRYQSEIAIMSTIVARIVSKIVAKIITIYFLVFPTGDTNLSNEHLDMLQIDCLVTGTKAISLSRIVEQDDDEVRVEIEV